MKALLYKDLCVLWSQMKFVLFFVALFCAMPDTGLCLNTFFVVYAGILVPISLFAYDERARWDALAAMLPFSVRDLVLSRYLLSWLSTAFAILCYLAGQVIFSPGHVPTRTSLLTLVFIVALFLLVQAVYFPLLFRLGAEKGRLAIIVVIAAVACLGAIGADLFTLVSAAPAAAFPPVFLAAALLLSLASVKAAERQYARRAW